MVVAHFTSRCCCRLLTTSAHTRTYVRSDGVSTFRSRSKSGAVVAVSWGGGDNESTGSDRSKCRVQTSGALFGYELPRWKEEVRESKEEERRGVRVNLRVRNYELQVEIKLWFIQRSGSEQFF